MLWNQQSHILQSPYFNTGQIMKLIFEKYSFDMVGAFNFLSNTIKHWFQILSFHEGSLHGPIPEPIWKVEKGEENLGLWWLEKQYG